MRAALTSRILAAFFLLGSIVGLSQGTPDPWLILASSEKGTINGHITRADLVRVYGRANVVDRDVEVGEGETEPGTIIFPNDPKRSIEILWKDPGQENSTR